MTTHAIVYFSGIVANPKRSDPLVLADALAASMRPRASAPNVQFTTEKLEPIAYGENRTARAARVIKETPGAPRAQLDIYVLPYLETAMQKKRSSTLWKQMLSLLGTVILNTPALGRMFKLGTAGSRVKLIHVFWIITMSSALAAYFFLLSLLIMAAVAGNVGADALKTASGPVGGALADIQEKIRQYVSPYFYYILSAHFIAPALASAKVRAAVVDAGLSALLLLGYMGSGRERPELTNHLESLAAKLDSSGHHYDAIHVIGYSFGAVAAVDSIFQTGKPPAALSRVASMTTIGFPYESFAEFWPEHFKHRAPAPNVQLKWINVHNALDPLGSDFNNPKKPRLVGIGGAGIVPNVHIESAAWGVTSDAGWLRRFAGAILLFGLDVHASYWDPDNVEEKNCFGPIVENLLVGSFI